MKIKVIMKSAWIREREQSLPYYSSVIVVKQTERIIFMNKKALKVSKYIYIYIYIVAGLLVSRGC